jgi:hypothetical protein
MASGCFRFSPGRAGLNERCFSFKALYYTPYAEEKLMKNESLLFPFSYRAFDFCEPVMPDMTGYPQKTVPDCDFAHICKDFWHYYYTFTLEIDFFFC